MPINRCFRFQLASDATLLLQCFPDEACLAGTNTPTSKIGSSNECALGYSGRQCGVCTDRYFKLVRASQHTLRDCRIYVTGRRMSAMCFDWWNHYSRILLGYVTAHRAALCDTLCCTFDVCKHIGIIHCCV